MTRRRQQVLEALVDAAAQGEHISLSKIARKVGVNDYRDARRIVADLKKMGHIPDFEPSYVPPPKKEHVKRPRKVMSSEEKREYRRRYYQANRDKLRERCRQYALTHRQEYRVYYARYRARKAGAEGSHTWGDIQEKWREQHGFCALCGQIMSGGFHVDHIIPLSKGGSDYPDNIQLACPPCNIGKGNKLIFTPLPVVENTAT